MPVCECQQVGKRREIAVHAVEAFDSDEDFPKPPAARQSADRALGCIDIVVGESVARSARPARAPSCTLAWTRESRRRRSPFLRQCRQHREIGDIAAAEEQRSLGAEKSRRFGFQSFVLGTISPEQARATGSDRRALGERSHDRLGRAAGRRRAPNNRSRQSRCPRAARDAAADPCGQARAGSFRIGRAALPSLPLHETPSVIPFRHTRFRNSATRAFLRARQLLPVNFLSKRRLSSVAQPAGRGRCPRRPEVLSRTERCDEIQTRFANCR